jgi:phosphoglucosamine mutase
MSNLGLEHFLGGLGLALHRARVGDRYVVERMRASGCNLGGEQSGHMIMSDYATTGDGLLAALQVLAVLVERRLPASEIMRVFEPLPQRLRSVRFAGPSPLQAATVRQAVAEAEAALGGSGRVLIRESGTEPVVRVMVEGRDEAQVLRLVNQLTDAIAAAAEPAAA